MRTPALTLPAVFAPQSALWDYLELTKPSVVWLILMSTAVGFYAGAEDPISYLLLLHTLLGTALLAAGAGTLNQWIEREADGKMRRTEQRPLPAGRLQPSPALLFGVTVSLAGTLYLIWAVNLLSALLGLLTLTSYLFLYTPLKTRTPVSTLVGAFPGAMPPLIGWVAASNRIEVESLVLFAMLFLWQFPHFYAIAWMYREDYARAGILMLPVVEPDGVSTSRRVVCYAALLIPASMAPTILGIAGSHYLAGALPLSLGYLCAGLLLARRKTMTQARRLLQASIVYLPLIYILLIVDKT